MKIEKQTAGKRTPRHTSATAKKTAVKMSRKAYETAMAGLQVELVKLQEWVRHRGLRVVVVFEGRDAAGKGGVIKRITERVSPRVFRVVALSAPTPPTGRPPARVMASSSEGCLSKCSTPGFPTRPS